MKLKQTGKLASHLEPWTLIRDAIADLKLQEKTKGVVIDMTKWHLPVKKHGLIRSKTVCYQCLAGSTVSRRCCIDISDHIWPHDLPFDVQQKMHALNMFRLGYVGEALHILGLGLPRYMNETITIPSYRENRVEFYNAMLRLADNLEYCFSVQKEQQQSWSDFLASEREPEPVC
jgi:hypothetical protein